MIKLHHLRGEEFYLNADLIESVEATPDTILTLFDGRKIVVAESITDVIDEILFFRASVLRVADDLRTRGADLIALPGGQRD
jgi:flagellar protein FlbD